MRVRNLKPGRHCNSGLDGAVEDLLDRGMEPLEFHTETTTPSVSQGNVKGRDR